MKKEASFVIIYIIYQPPFMNFVFVCNHAQQKLHSVALNC